MPVVPDVNTTTVYLLCFAPGIPRGAQPGPACHYLGSTGQTAEQRLTEHLTGRGSPLVKAAHDRGLVPRIVATWPGDRRTERKMKQRRHLRHFCPHCNSEGT